MQRVTQLLHKRVRSDDKIVMCSPASLSRYVDHRLAGMLRRAVMPGFAYCFATKELLALSNRMSYPICNTLAYVLHDSTWWMP